MKQNHFTTVECLRRAERAARQVEKMTPLNSSYDERDLTTAAIRTWTERAAYAEKNGGYWDHEYEPITDER